MRFAIFSHAHPLFSKGGGEMAAFCQYQGLVAAGHEAWFLARAPRSLCNTGLEVNALSRYEYLIASDTDFCLASSLTLHRQSALADLLKTIQPDVIHFHHYLHLGVELIRMAVTYCPEARIVLTLHEFMAICAHNGQMVTTRQRLCYKAHPRACTACFPDRTLEDFFLREQYIKSFFKCVDLFLVPSHFLKERYLDWGLPPGKVHFLEYGLISAPRLPLRSVKENKTRGRFAYFGQINPFKGVDVILEAFRLLPRSIRPLVRLNIYGSNMEIWPEAFQDNLQRLIRLNRDTVRYHGPYEHHELPTLMAATDWVIMGSIWWENSPLVIHEACTYGRPVICSDIGGMAEKVQDGVTGRHFRVGDPADLADVIEDVVISSADAYETLCVNLPIPWGIEKMTTAYLKLIEHRSESGRS